MNNEITQQKNKVSTEEMAQKLQNEVDAILSDSDIPTQEDLLKAFRPELMDLTLSFSL